jgi:hypothetical protein
MNILSHPVFKRQWWTKKRILIFIISFLIVIIMSVIRGAHQKIGTDFYAFWGAGRNFFTGDPLYPTVLIEGVRYFLYPPFAAMVFQIFAIFPLKVAGGLFYFTNIILLIASVYLTKLIFDDFYPDRTNLKWPLIFSVFFSARFFINNINLLQTNEIILVLCLLGIYAYLKKRVGLSCWLFTIATFLKIVPVFFLFWVIIRGRTRAVLSVILASAVCLGLPILLRGFETGTKDLAGYHQSFLKAFQEGKVRTTYLNQNLASAIYRMALPSQNEENLNYQLISLSEDTVKVVYKLSFIAILLLFVSNLVFLSVKRFPISPFEINGIFLVGALLSGITQKAQLIPLIFVLMAFLSIDYKKLTKYYRYVFWVLYSLIVILGITGREILGAQLHYYFGGYSIITWILLILFICSIWFSIKLPEKEFTISC